MNDKSLNYDKSRREDFYFFIMFLENVFDKYMSLCYIVNGHRKVFLFWKKHIFKVGEMMKKIRTFFIGVKKEMKKVRWTTKKELIKYSVATLSCIIFFGLFFAATDFVLAALTRLVG